MLKLEAGANTARFGICKGEIERSRDRKEERGISGARIDEIKKATMSVAQTHTVRRHRLD